MKKQQRTFVVEIKSAGRRPVARQESIWGSTDLKAFVRQAESDAPQLFKQAQQGNTLKHRVANLPDLELAPPNETLGPDDAQGVTAPDLLLERAPQNVQVGAMASPEKAAPESASVEVPAPNRRKLVKRQTHRATNAVDFTTVTVPIEESVDELVALDTENRRLKALWARHIRRQNAQLQEMLLRFGVF